jgi:hypothetical protein
VHADRAQLEGDLATVQRLIDSGLFETSPSQEATRGRRGADRLLGGIVSYGSIYGAVFLAAAVAAHFLGSEKLYTILTAAHHFARM